MDKGSRIVIRAASLAAARARPPTPAVWTQDGVTARVLPDRDGLRVLVADDDADTADSLALLLRMLGHEVWAAYSGAEALATAFGCRPDVMLLDVAMPDLDGFRLARAIRQQTFLDRVLLVAVTGYGDEGHRQAGMRAGFDHYLVKPVEPSVIQALLLLAAGDRETVRTARAAEVARRAIPAPRSLVAQVHEPAAGRLTVRMPNAGEGDC